jgi:tetraacyldisaccharide 4'-kinase
VGKKFNDSQKDEQILIQKRAKLFLDRKRKKIIDKAINDNNEMIIFDDGLQEKKIDYNLKFVCFDKDNWIGNGLLIPSGPLRENLDSLKKYDAIFFKQIDEKKLDNKIIDKIKEINPQIKIFYSEYIFKNLEDFDLKKKYFIFSGIGSSNSFKELLLKHNFSIIDEINYPDHFNYQQNDLDTIVKKAKINQAEIITTEKDFTKISNLNHKNISPVKLDLKINDEKNLLNFIKSKLYA